MKRLAKTRVGRSQSLPVLYLLDHFTIVGRAGFDSFDAGGHGRYAVRPFSADLP
jgi:hypothetical protein